MPSTYASRAIGSYRAQAQTKAAGVNFDRNSSATSSSGGKKETFAEVLKDHLQKTARN